MKKILLVIFFLFSLLTSTNIYSQQIDTSQIKVMQIPNLDHVCTLDPTDINAHFYLTPARHMQKQMESAASLFETDYIIAQGSSCGDQTWPQDAIEAFEYALDIWSIHLRSDVILKIEAVWRDIESDNGTILANAGPYNGTVLQISGTGEPNTWYTPAQLSAMTGRTVREELSEPISHDIVVNVNCSFNNWHFKTEGNPPQNTIDFTTVILHEIGHGIGFFGSMTVPENVESASWGLGENRYPLIYEKFVIDGNMNSLLNQSVYPNPSGELFEALTGRRGGVFFDGEDALLTLQGLGEGSAPLYSPQDWNPGSSFSHVDQQTFSGTVNALMRPRIDRAMAIHSPGPLLCGMLSDMGWPLGVGCLGFLAADAVIALDTRNLNFGVINLGEVSTQILTVISSPESVETLSGTVTLEGTQFSVVGSSGFELEPGQSAEVTIRYEPDSAEIHTGMLQLFHNAKNEQPPINIELTGEALEEGRIVQLDQSYPNPIVPDDPAPRIPYSITRDSNVKLDLFTMNGQHVRSIVNEMQISGRYEADVDVAGLSSGVYIYRILVDGVARSGKLMLFQ